MSNHAHLQLHYRCDRDQGTQLSHQHQGPLRILKSLYPEGPGICHNVVVHPPGGLVGGDQLLTEVRVDAGAHALISTPGATRFYAADRAPARQAVHLRLAAGARLEWLPLESIAYPGCRAENHFSAELAPGAELLAWDVTALGLPGAQQAFDRVDAAHGVSEFSQRLEVPGLWLEQAQIRGDDARLLNAPLGLQGQRCLASLVVVAGQDFERGRRDTLLQVVRDSLASLGSDCIAGATSPNGRMVVVRVLGPVVEPVMAGLQSVWQALRPALWGLPAARPRIWGV